MNTQEWGGRKQPAVLAPHCSPTHGGHQTNEEFSKESFAIKLYRRIEKISPHIPHEHVEVTWEISETSEGLEKQESRPLPTHIQMGWHRLDAMQN